MGEVAVNFALALPQEYTVALNTDTHNITHCTADKQVQHTYMRAHRTVLTANTITDKVARTIFNNFLSLRTS